MADLIDRLTHESETMVPPRPGIKVHSFAAEFVLYAAGARTSQEVIQSYDLQGEELTQAQAIVTVMNGKSNVTAKLIYAEKVVASLLLLSDPPDGTSPTPNVYFDAQGNVNKVRVAADLEI